METEDFSLSAKIIDFIFSELVYPKKIKIAILAEYQPMGPTLYHKRVSTSLKK